MGLDLIMYNKREYMEYNGTEYNKITELAYGRKTWAIESYFASRCPYLTTPEDFVFDVPEEAWDEFYTTAINLGFEKFKIWVDVISEYERIGEHMGENMDDEDDNSAEREKKRQENKKLIDEVNEKIAEEEDRLLEIPKEIKDANERLMILSMDYFFFFLRVNHTEAQEIEEWIAQVRIDLKKNIIRKQNRTINNKEIYSYLHDIFGAEVLDLFDIQFHQENDNW